MPAAGQGDSMTHGQSDAAPTTVSDELEHWLGGDQPKTPGNFVELFGPRSFALIFVLLMALPTLPLPTGGARGGLEGVAALQLGVGRRCIGLPARWQRLELGPPSRQKLLTALLRRSRCSSRSRGEPAVRAPRCRERVRSTDARARADRVARTAVLRPRHPALARRRRDRTGVLRRDLLLALLGGLLGAIGWPRSLGSGPRRRNGQALALAPDVTPGPASMQSCPGRPPAPGPNGSPACRTRCADATRQCAG